MANIGWDERFNAVVSSSRRPAAPCGNIRRGVHLPDPRAPGRWRGRLRRGGEWPLIESIEGKRGSPRLRPGCGWLVPHQQCRSAAKVPAIINHAGCRTARQRATRNQALCRQCRRARRVRGTVRCALAPPWAGGLRGCAGDPLTGGAVGDFLTAEHSVPADLRYLPPVGGAGTRSIRLICGRNAVCVLELWGMLPLPDAAPRPRRWPKVALPAVDRGRPWRHEHLRAAARPWSLSTRRSRGFCVCRNRQATNGKITA